MDHFLDPEILKKIFIITHKQYVQRLGLVWDLGFSMTNFLHIVNTASSGADPAFK